VFDLAELRPILGDLGLAGPTSANELAGGSNRAFRIDLADGTAVVLKTYDDLRGKLPTREAYAASLLTGLDVPVTRYLALDDTRSRLPFRFAVTNHLPGVTVASLLGELDIADIYWQMGELLRKLHTVRLPAFGHFDDHGIMSPIVDHAAYMAGVASHAFTQFRKFGAPDALAGRLERIVAENAHLFAQSRGPVFAHDDFHVGNILAERDGEGRLRLTGLIDFGNARAADAVFDLAKTLFMADHDAPGASPIVRAGYGAIDHPDPDAALWLHTLLHRVIMWWWLRHVGVVAEGQPNDLIPALEAMAEQGARPSG
jgi:aminoglycoside phosphotransferase (APT) family kinase protein